LSFTVKQALLSTLLALALGLPGAWFLSSGQENRFLSLLRALSGIPFAMPSILVVLGFVLFFGNAGWLNQMIMEITGRNEGGVRILYRPAAVVLAHGFYNFPLVIRLAGDGLRQIRRAYSPAAAVLGSHPVKTVFTVLLPLSLPSIAGASLLVFLYCFTSFAVVLVLGGGPGTSTLAVEIYRQARISLNYDKAALLALVETLISVGVFVLFLLVEQGIPRTTVDRDRSMETRKPFAVYWFGAGLYGVLMLLLVAGPLLALPLESLLYRATRSGQAALSLRWWFALGDSALPALCRSLLLACTSATLACLLAGPAAAALVCFREQQGISNLIKAFTVAPLVSSGIVLGLGWLMLYGGSRGSFGNGRGELFSPAFFAAALVHAVLALPFAFNSISGGIKTLPSNIFRAATSSGAAPPIALATAILPLAGTQIRSAWAFAAVLSLGELNAVMMLGLENWETLPLLIYRAAGAYRYGPACAAGTLLILCCALLLLLAELPLKRKNHGS
jgi:thiamine transport system permease protein